MKKLLVLAALTIAMSLFMSSCSNDETTGPGQAVLGEMSAKVDGTDWKVANAVYYNSTKLITGVKVDNTDPLARIEKTISINLTTDDATPKVKTYTALCFYKEKTGTVISSNAVFWSVANGICNITKVTDNEITGTFTFTGVNDALGTSKIVEGSFYVPVQ